MTVEDPFNLSRFVQAQDAAWGDVLHELRQAKKTSHWMWFVFPQLAALGRSEMAKRYGLSGIDEAGAYVAHPVLGRRLREACSVLLDVRGDAVEIFGQVDAMKLRSSLTLFIEAAPGEDTLTQCLQHYFDGMKDIHTLRLLAG